MIVYSKNRANYDSLFKEQKKTNNDSLFKVQNKY